MEALRSMPMIFILLCISGVIAGATVLTITQFSATTTNAATIAVLGNATSGMSTVAQQFPTIGIIAVMVIIISLIAGVMGYMAYFR